MCRERCSHRLTKMTTLIISLATYKWLCPNTAKFNSIDSHPWHLIGSRSNWCDSLHNIVLRQLHHRRSESSAPPDVVNPALISRDDVKRQSDQVQTINCIEVSDSNEWYRLAPFHYTNTGSQIEINSPLGTPITACYEESY